MLICQDDFELRVFIWGRTALGTFARIGFARGGCAGVSIARDAFTRAGFARDGTARGTRARASFMLDVLYGAVSFGGPWN